MAEAHVGIGQLLNGIECPDKEFELDTVVRGCAKTLWPGKLTQSQETDAVPGMDHPYW